MNKFLNKIFICTTAFVVMATSTGYARTNNQLETKNNSQITDYLKSSNYNYFKSDARVQNIINKISKKAKKVSVNELYYKIEQNKDGKVESKPYTKQEYLNETKKGSEKITPQIISPGHSRSEDYGWLKLELEVSDFGNNQCSIGAFYRWEKQPLYQAEDLFAIGHDSNILFDTANSFFIALSPYDDISGYHQEVERVTGTDPNKCKSDPLGVAFKFLCISTSSFSQGDIDYPFGMAYVDGTLTNNVGANISISYTHRTLATDYNIQDAINFLTSGSISIKVKNVDETKGFGDELTL